MNNYAALIPIKGFESAKERLSTVLKATKRASLAKQLATEVIKSCSELSVWVVCEDDTVEFWANDLGVNVIRNPKRGLNEAAYFGFHVLREKGFNRVLIAHGDLMRPEGLPSLIDLAEIVIVPDAKLDGTNVLVLPTSIEFTFSYGPDSYSHHLHCAKETGLSLSVVEDSNFAFDIDDPDDLRRFSLEDEFDV